MVYILLSVSPRVEVLKTNNKYDAAPQSRWNGMELLGLNLKYSSEMGAGKITRKQALGTVLSKMRSSAHSLAPAVCGTIL